MESTYIERVPACGWRRKSSTAAQRMEEAPASKPSQALKKNVDVPFDMKERIAAKIVVARRMSSHKRRHEA